MRRRPLFAAAAALALTACGHRPHHAAQTGPPVTEAPEVLAMSLVRPDYTPSPTTTTTTTTRPVVPATVAPAVTAEVEPEVVPVAAAAPVRASGSVWDRLAVCESGGNWHVNTGNGFFGGLQFSLRSWQWVGGSGYPHEHSREMQIAMAERLLARQGWGAWPACSRKLGLR